MGFMTESLCIYVYIYVNKYIYISMYMHVCMFVCMYVRMYIYIYMWARVERFKGLSFFRVHLSRLPSSTPSRRCMTPSPRRSADGDVPLGDVKPEPASARTPLC